MDPLIFKIAYIVILAGTSIIRYPHEKRNKANSISNDNKTTLEKTLLFLVFLGMMILPLLYILTPLFSFADYTLPFFAQITGIVLIVPILWLFRRSHKDLGLNWSVTLEIREGHNVVDTGVYKYIRHPMYSAIWLWGIAQALLLQNYIAGFSGLICFGMLYLLRVQKEEEMMLKEFGEEYRAYQKRTKRIIPFVI